MANPPLCQPCSAIGLPIIPLWYAVVPAHIRATVPSQFSGARVQDVALDPQQYKYVVRFLRQGFVYLFYEEGPRGRNYWEVYSVAPNGSLWKQIDGPGAQPLPAVPSCSRTGHSSIRKQFFVIERPDQCGKVWIAFTQDKWSDETLAHYASADRSKRFQSIQPRQWIDNPQQPHAARAQDVLSKVLELDPGVNVADLPYHQHISAISQENGDYRADKLTQQSTRYPYAEIAHGTPDLRFQWSTYLIEDATKAGQRPQLSPVPPMALALWDAVGIAHELNGYRNDPAGWMDKYKDERELQITAMNAIEGARKALENRAAGRVDETFRLRDEALRAGWTEEFFQSRRRHAQTLPAPQRARALALVAQYERDAQSGVPYRTVVPSRDAIDQLPEPARTQKMAELDQRASAVPQRRAQAHADERSDAIARSWPPYEKKLDIGRLNTFKQNYEKLLAETDTLIDRRTSELIKWLEAPLFVDTLDDYHTSNLGDGIAFEDVVGDAIYGIGSSASGRRKLDAWIEEAKASVRTNLVWRAIALNQEEGKTEVDAALAHARSVDVLLSAETWAATGASVRWSKLADLYKKAQTLANTNIRAAQAGSGMRAVATLGFEKIFTTIGDRLGQATFARRLDSVISEKIMQTLFLTRAGAHVDDVLDLVQTQARVEGLDRIASNRRMQTARAFSSVMEDADGRLRPNAEVLTRKWTRLAEAADVPDATGRFNAAKDARIALVVALFEAFNLAKSGHDAAVRVDGKSMVVLTSAVMGLSAACVDVYTNVVKGALEESSYTFQKMKFLGGSLATAASLISSAASFMDAFKAARDRQYGSAALQVAVGLINLGAGTANALATLTYCGSYLATVAQRQGLRAGTVAAIRATAARAAAVAATRLMMYRAGLMLGGLTLNLIALGIQLAIWYYTDDELQEWCEKSAFGLERNNGGYPNNEAQLEGYYRATYAVGV